MKSQKTAFEQVIRSAGRCIGRYNLIEEGDSLLVGLSGGKDSFVLLETLLVLQRKSPVKFSLAGAVFDPGFPGFPLEEIRNYCEKRNVAFHSTGVPIPQVLAERPSDKPACVLCSRLRRGKLYGLAQELKCTKLVLGHHLDDLLASFLISALRGGGLTTMAPVSIPDARESCPVIRPLALTDESLIAEAAKSFDFPTDRRCPYHHQLELSGDRAKAKRLLAQLENDFPGARKGLTASLAHVEADHLLDLKFLPGQKNERKKYETQRCSGKDTHTFPFGKNSSGNNC